MSIDQKGQTESSPSSGILRKSYIYTNIYSWQTFKFHPRICTDVAFPKMEKCLLPQGACEVVVSEIDKLMVLVLRVQGQ